MAAAYVRHGACIQPVLLDVPVYLPAHVRAQPYRTRGIRRDWMVAGERDAERAGGRGGLGWDRGHAADVALRSARVRVSLVLSVRVWITLSMILIKQHCPSENSVGMAYGLASFAQCLARALSPTIMSSIYALAQEYNILHGFGWVPAMVLISLGGVLQSASVVRATR
ncbi:hypothetical protein HWV62_12841 [Athelia sp. TMB]|nr:hypothetical protein HWV62_12841 [Athelia sp. TMB]